MLSWGPGHTVGLIGLRQSPRTRKLRFWPVIRTEIQENKKGLHYKN